MKLKTDVIVDGEWILLDHSLLETLRIQLATPFCRPADGAVKPVSMPETIEKLRAANFAIGYRRAA